MTPRQNTTTTVPTPTEVALARRELLDWTASLGAITAEALAVRLDIGPPAARSRLAAVVRRGLLARSRPLAQAPSLYTLTAAGARAGGWPSASCRVTPSTAAHLIAVAAVAAALERCYPGYRALGERELRRAERLRLHPLASARMGALHGGASGLHRPDLVLEPCAPREPGGELPVAIEVELSIKEPARLRAICRAWERCPAVAGVVYLAPRRVEPALRRAVAATGAQRIAVVPLAALPLAAAARPVECRPARHVERRAARPVEQPAAGAPRTVPSAG